ncbi:MAG: hypothetical protein HXX17_05840 [Geobacteraceae bacterium]|nr:hypothetical protein [Geobacteraceae bacterium]
MIVKTGRLLVVLLLSVAFTGCASPPAIVGKGDQIELGFLCRLPDGSVAATTKTDSEVAIEARSAFYLPRTGPDTVTLVAGLHPEDPGQDRLPFEDEIIKRLRQNVVGLKEGKESVVTLSAERYPATSQKDRFVRIAKVRKRQKEMRLTREEYTKQTGRAPEAGQSMASDPMVPGKVSEVTDSEVVIRFAPQTGLPLTTPFGAIELRETATNYELEIKAEKGRLVRTGGMVGRIISVDSDSIQIDYGHPFGGEKLLCNLAVKAVKPATKTGGEQETAPLATSAGQLDPAAEKIFDAGMARINADEHHEKPGKVLR